MRAIFVCFAFFATRAVAEEAALPFPPEIVRQTEYAASMSRHMQKFGSEPIWHEAALEGFERRYRVTLIAPSFIRAHEVQIVIDGRSDGSARLIGKVFETQSVGVFEHVERELSPSDFDAFLELTDRSGLWATLPESWRRRPESFCAHGRTVVLERRDDRGYGLSDAEHCTAPSAMVLVIDRMLELARFETRQEWRPGMWWE